MEWQPIATAPRDGTKILVWREAELGYAGRRIGVDKWHKNRWWHSRLNMQPTHWMPLPDPPKDHAK